jgi:hypothetical protein
VLVDERHVGQRVLLPGEDRAVAADLHLELGPAESHHAAPSGRRWCGRLGGRRRRGNVRRRSRAREPGNDAWLFRELEPRLIVGVPGVDLLHGLGACLCGRRHKGRTHEVADLLPLHGGSLTGPKVLCQLTERHL